jgi:hypothetical protein
MSDVNGTETQAEPIEATEVAVVENRLPERDKHRARDIKFGARGITFDNAADVMAYARMMADSSLAVPACLRNNPGACLAVIDDAVRFGLSPYALARETYVVKNKEGIESIAYMAKAVTGIIIANAPIAKRPKVEYEGVGGERCCIVTFTLRNGDEIVHRSPQWKDIKVKNSPLWFSDPDQQLGYYTLRSGSRLHFPDILMGLYDGDEMEAVDVTPAPKADPVTTSGLSTRLPGPQATGFDPSHIDREISGDEGDGADPDAPTMPEGIPTDEAAFLEELGRLLKHAKTELEVGAIASTSAEQRDAMSKDGQVTAAKMIEDRMEALAKPKAKRK